MSQIKSFADLTIKLKGRINFIFGIKEQTPCLTFQSSWWGWWWWWW